MKILLAMLMCLGFTSCVSILGPSDKPQFSTMKWRSMNLTYWTKDSTNTRIEHSLIIDDSASLKEGFNLLAKSKVKGHSLASGKQIVLRTEDGVVWRAQTVFEDRVDFTLESDLYYSYILTPRSFEFYNWLRDLCVRDLRSQGYSDVTNKNVILRSNLSIDSYPITSKLPL